MSVTISTLNQKFAPQPCRWCEEDGNCYGFPPGKCTGFEDMPVYPELNMSNVNFGWFWRNLGMEVTQDLCGDIKVDSPEWGTLYATVAMKAVAWGADTYEGQKLRSLFNILRSVEQEGHEGICWG